MATTQHPIAHDYSPHDSDTGGMEKSAKEIQVEHVRTNERVEGHPDYYEKDGLRTYGDGMDHDHEAPVSLFKCCFVCPDDVIDDL